ncbi:Ig-like domain-containing protein, partial [Ensifer sp. ENS12]|uniref:beta strand repeat-containing protein n=4 Tax=Ensifer sp. ENS12 TaxID=2854774 RepID=UPI0021067B28
AASASLTLDDQTLADGSTPGSNTSAGTIGFAAGTDAIATIAFGDTSGLTGALTWDRVSDTQIIGRAGGVAIVTLDLVRSGDSATVTATLNDNYASHPGVNADDLASLGSVKVIASDTDGDTAEGTVNVSVSDDVPVIGITDPASSNVVEGQALAGNWTLSAGADGVSTVDVTVGNTTQTLALTAGQSVVFALAEGTLTVNADKTWSFDAASNLNNAGGVNVTFSLSATDADGDTTIDSQTITVTDGAGPTVDPLAASASLTLDDQTLADGSTPGSNTSAGTIGFAAGSDAIATIAFGDTSGLTGALTWDRVSDTQIIGRAGGVAIVTLDLVRSGDSATVTATLNDNYASHPGVNADDLASLGSVKVIASDTDGDTAEGTVNVSVSDDVPTAVDDGAQSVVEGGAQISGNVLGNDTAGADGATLTSVTIGGTEHTVAASGSTPVVTANGTYSFTSAGAWTFTPVASLNSASAVNAGFSYKITDGDGDTATAVQPISITDGAGPTATDGSASITVAEQGLDNANALGSAEGAAGGAELSPAERGADTVSFTAGSDAITGMVFGATGGITADVNGIAGADIVWSGAGTSVLTGTINGVAAITVTLVPPALPIAPGANGQATINVQLSDNFPHPAGLAQNTIDLTGITVVASDQDGDSATATVGISVVDDVPTAVDDSAQSVVEGGAQISGNVLGNDTAGADGATLTSVTIGGTEHTVAASGSTPVVTANGTYSFTSAGAWTFTPVASLNSASAVNAGFSYKITDGDGDTATAVQPISITDGAGPTATDGSASITVAEQGLDNANALGSAEGAAGGAELSPAERGADTVSFTAGSDAITGMVFGATGGITADVNGI